MFVIVYHLCFCFSTIFSFFLCGPAEEGEPFHLSAEWSANESFKEITIKKADMLIGYCHIYNGCSSSFMRFKIDLVNSGGDQYIATVHINYTLRTDTNNWTIAYMGKRSTSTSLIDKCYLKTYIKPVNVSCQVLKSEDGIKIACLTEKVFPEAICTFSILKNGVYADYNNTKITYYHTTLTGKVQHYYSRCEFMLHNYQITPGMYTIISTLHPNLKIEKYERYGVTHIVNFTIGCGPAEEGQEFSFIAKRKNIGTDITIRKGISMIGKCSASGCTSYYDTKFNISDTGDQDIKVTIYRVSRSDAGNWTVSYIGSHASLITSCNIVPFVKAVNVTCYSEKHSEGINVTCSAMKIYPRAKCRFQVYVDGKESTIRNNVVTYRYEKCTDGEEFCESSCTNGISKSDFLFGKYEIRITLLPDIQVVDENVKYASTAVVNFLLEKPLLRLTNCPILVTEETNVTCECSAVNSSSAVDIRWYSQHGDLLKNGNIITFIAHKSLAEYRCEGTDSIISLINQSTSYKPQVLREMKNINCTSQFTNENIAVICSTLETYSRVSCIFNVTYYNPVLTEPENIHFVTKHHFNSTCTLILHKFDFHKAGIYNVWVTMYPTFTQTNEDVKYGARSFLQFTIGDAILKKEISQANLLQIISISSVAVFMIIIIALAVICITVVKKRRKRHRIGLDKVTSGLRMLNDYKKDYLEEKGHHYESVIEDHYDVCGTYSALDRCKQYDSESDSYESPINNVENYKVCTHRNLLDTEYITPIELDIILGKQT